MNQKIREYIEELFEDAPKTRAAVDLREEIINNGEEKMADLLSQGYKEEDAFDIVIHSIGNVEELFSELRGEEEEREPLGRQRLQKKRAVITSASVGIYILALAVLLIFASLEDYTESLLGMETGMIGVIFACILCIPPTCMLIYSSMMYPKYQKKEENMVEEYRAWKNERKKDKAVKDALSTVLWTLGIACYFVVSFTTGAWGITWVIFLILACLESIISLVFSLKKDEK